ncbi:MAG: UvrD-helicase domain-containing protein [Gammaproteobacteria bacterium]
MSNNTVLNAANPALSASVLASAGTGKTWMLVARLTRLLLAGADPRRILALTFTRKAAGEMQQRLLKQLKTLLQADDTELDKQLIALGEQPDNDMRDRARNLYESLLLSEQPLRTSTFHGFCQDLLQRFPLEAGLPPGFELADTTGLLYEQAWDALFARASEQPDGQLAGDLDLLFDLCGGLSNVHKALYNFLSHRSDWWAFTQHQSTPVTFAEEKLKTWLDIEPGLLPADSFWTTENRLALEEFVSLLEQHATKTNSMHSQLIRQALESTASSTQCLQTITPVFLTQTGGRRARSPSKTLQKKMGEPGEIRFLELHTQLCEQLENCRELQARLDSWLTSTAWYRCGTQLLDHYQRIKRERRLVDFTDLEWKAYTLLSHPEQAHWIQYKIDQRIDHLLIDEFQDTNPTQWRLLKPLLDEMSSSDERNRSLFLVGDAKQSIYRFRRGDPALLKTAIQTMQLQLDAQQFQLDSSWRSAPAIIDCINKVFAGTEFGELLPDYSQHETHLTSLWGHVELWPLFEDLESLLETTTEIELATKLTLRNPLQTPRLVIQKRPHYLEGQAIAQKIQSLLAKPVVLEAGDQARAANYNDIIILLRSRTHLDDYETALREQKIPYLSMNRGTLLDSLEIRDMEALLNLLMTPQDNLALAQVLRSPIFSATDVDLLEIAKGPRGAWIDKLSLLAASLPEQHTLSYAFRMLTQWQELAGRIPIHDLLDQIYHQADILNRYQAAFPATLTPRLRANLVRFIELALEVDAGRYPSLPHFLSRLRQLRSLDDEAPDQAQPDSASGQRVRIMTIHAAKGLEAPIVFLADTGRQQLSKNSYNALVRWPAEAAQPDHMLLRSKNMDSKTRALAELEKQEEMRESANLLYVALTRARQMLFISGCKVDKASGDTWYSAVASGLRQDDILDEEILVLDSGKIPAAHKQPATIHSDLPAINPALLLPATVPNQVQEIAPSHAANTALPESTDTGRLRGRAVHLLLQLATEQPARTSEQLCTYAAGRLTSAVSKSDLMIWWKSLSEIINQSELEWVFKPDSGTQVWNEVPVEFSQDNKTVYGIIDRLIIKDNAAHIIDYKTHRINDAPAQQKLCDHYRPQLALYKEGITRLWPDKTVKTWLLFTHTGALVAL